LALQPDAAADFRPDPATPDAMRWRLPLRHIERVTEGAKDIAQTYLGGDFQRGYFHPKRDPQRFQAGPSWPGRPE
jgi:hypothetical protein